jgi:YVTN family beta-propeller protein
MKPCLLAVATDLQIGKRSLLLEAESKRILVAMIIGLLLPSDVTIGAEAEVETAKMATHLRRPVALAAVGKRLLVANRRSGTITEIELASDRVVAEHSIAVRIADMAKLRDSGDILVIDDASRRLLHVAVRAEAPLAKPVADLPAAASKLLVARRWRQVFVTAKWPRRVMAFTFNSEFERIEKTQSIDLPFAPQELLLLDDEKTLLVADAFGGRIALIDIAEWKLCGERKLDAHNIRGMALSADGKRLHVAHQQLIHKLADYEELHWGRMLKNAVQVIEVQKFLNSDSIRPIKGWLYTQGDIGGATGDPGGVVTGPESTWAIALSGVGEVSVGYGGYVKRIPVGARPEAMVFDGDRLYIANRFDDSISVIDLKRGAIDKTISLGPAPKLTSAERGEKLFYDARLSHDGWMSCHSCHTDGHSTGLLVDTLGDGDYGAPKRVPSLLGTRNTGPWGWTGRMASLGDQVRSSVETTMHGDPVNERQISDLVAFLESLPSPPSPSRTDQKTVARGQAVFHSRGCVNCHKSPTFTSKQIFDVGLTDERNRSSFNPPSLRGVSQRSRFFHDGRASSLEEVVQTFRHKLDEPLSSDKSEALLAYLRSL